jgi:hypothetical protein
LYDCVEKDTTYDIHKSQAADHFSNALKFRVPPNWPLIARGAALALGH